MEFAAATTFDKSNVYAEVRESTPTQNDGRIKDEENESYSTQVVPSREPEAFLRLKDDQPSRENISLRLQLPTAANSEILIHLGRLKSNELNSS